MDHKANFWTSDYLNTETNYRGSSVQTDKVRTNLIINSMRSSNHDIGSLRRNGFKGRDIGGDWDKLTYRIILKPSDVQMRNAWASPSSPTGFNYTSNTVLSPVNINQRTINDLESNFVNDQPDRFHSRVEQLVNLPGTTMWLNGLGATAVSRVAPTNPIADTATTVAELISERKFFSIPGKDGTASGEWLNLQLAILPLIGYAGDMREAFETNEKVIKQLERDSGKLIRRSYYFPEEREVTTTVTNVRPWSIGGSMNTYFSRVGKLVHTRTVTRESWFKGAFTYYLPKQKWRRSLAHLDKSYGITPGVDTAWELIPYSFVADYFANTGDVLKNLDTFYKDGLVMPYGYIMSTQRVVDEYIWSGLVTNESGQFIPRTTTCYITRESKQRRAANPFGFGINPSDLSARQVSILAALGINRK